jgi:ParB-like chromosome segregation protein Spo0J
MSSNQTAVQVRAGGAVGIEAQFDVERLPVQHVPVDSLRTADSPRLAGEDLLHIRALADLDDPLPPILVHESTRQVIDGMHRLMAARLRGAETIAVRFFEGSTADAFVLAVKANIAHGLPLSVADRKAAAGRIIDSHPHWSDRMIASMTGLAAKTVKSVRGCPSSDIPQLDGRIGLDGRIRPMDASIRRAIAAKLIAENPHYSLRKIAHYAGISPETARSIRSRLRGGEVQAQVESGRAIADQAQPAVGVVAKRQSGLRRMNAAAASKQVGGDPYRSLQILLDDPALRSKELGRMLLRALSTYRLLERHAIAFAESVPEHDLNLVSQVALANATAWHALVEVVQQRREKNVS